jgi:hypothetical protein
MLVLMAALVRMLPRSEAKPQLPLITLGAGEAQAITRQDLVVLVAAAQEIRLPQLLGRLTRVAAEAVPVGLLAQAVQALF